MGVFKDTIKKTRVRETTGGIFRQQAGGRKRRFADLSTSEGLRNVALSEGFDTKVRRVEKRIEGEDPERLFSGGVVQDIFDGLNIMQHGVTGTLQGIGFAEGVKTRASFTKEEAFKDRGIPGLIAGIGLDIIVDPLTWIAPATIFRKIPGAVKGSRAVINAVKKTKAGQKVGRAFVYGFGQDPVYKTIKKRSTRDISIGTSKLIELARPIAKLSSKVQKSFLTRNKLGQVVRKSPDELAKLSPEILAKAKPAFDEIDRLGVDLVKEGVLDEKTWRASAGEYIANLYRKDASKLAKAIDRLKGRTDVSDEVRKALGEILEAGYPTARSLVDMNTLLERARFYKRVSKTFSKSFSSADEAAAEGFKLLPKTKRLGELSGKYVPTPIADDLAEVLKTRSKFNKVENIVVGGFKYGKVILNPATHARNIMSNFILNSFEGLSPARLDIYAKAAKSLATKDDLYQAAVKQGLGANTFATAELGHWISEGAPELFKGGKVSRAVRNSLKKVSDIYQGEEEYAKLAQFIFQKSKGLTDEAAFGIAERATFNYSEVTPFIRRIRESIFGYPFITFTYKATPQVAKTLAHTPTKISNIGKVKNAIENLVPRDDLKKERANEPQWIKNGMYIRLPGTDKIGRARYFDMTYIMPLGDLVTAQFTQRDRPEETRAEALLSNLPFLSAANDLIQNRDFFGNKIYKDQATPAEFGADITRYLMTFYLPSFTDNQVKTLLDKDTRERLGIKGLLPFRIGESVAFEQKVAEDPKSTQFRTTRTVGQEVARSIFGLKALPINVEREMAKRERELREKFTELLKDEGIALEKKIPFLLDEE